MRPLLQQPPVSQKTQDKDRTRGTQSRPQVTVLHAQTIINSSNPGHLLSPSVTPVTLHEAWGGTRL